MKIGVISDTHLVQGSCDLEQLLTGPFREVDLVLHAGDITEPAVLEPFAPQKILAVCGNMDSAALRHSLPAKRVVQAGKFKIGLIHGWGAPVGIEERITQEFPQVNGVVYGHTHIPSCRWRDGVFFFNPGAFSGGSLPDRPRSCGVLEVGDQIRGEVLFF